MISLRSHAISLAAVFLALAIGVVLGSGLLSNSVLSGMRDDKTDLQNQINSLTDQKNALNEKLSAADQFNSSMADRVVRDALKDRAVTLFRAPNAQDSDIEALTDLIGKAGGRVSGTVELTQEFVDANSAEKLRTVVNSAILPAGTQLNTALMDPGAQAGDLLGIALLNNRDPKAPKVDEPQRQTVLTALRDTGFIAYPGDNVAPADSALIVTGGTMGDDAGNQGATVARFADGMAPHGFGTVLAGRDGAAEGTAAIAVVRSDPQLSAAVTTIDDIGTAAGRITTVLALQDLINGGRPAQYGVGLGANAVTVGQ